MTAIWQDLANFCSGDYLYEGLTTPNILFSLPNNIISVYEETLTYFVWNKADNLEVLVWLNPNQLNLDFLFDLLSTTNNNKCTITIVSTQATTYICSWYGEIANKIPKNWSIMFAKNSKERSSIEFILIKN